MLRVFDAFDYHASTMPDALFAEDEDQSLSYSEAARRADEIAQAFLEKGTRKAERVGILSRNTADMLLFIIAISKIGAVPVPINVRLTPENWDWIIKDAGCRFVVGETNFLSALKPAISGAGKISLISLDRSSSKFPNIDNLIASTQTPTVTLPVGDDAFIQIYTSGTTGFPKGVVLSHRNSTSQTASFASAATTSLGSRQTCLQSLPLFHIGGVFVALYVVFGGGCVVLRRTFDPAEQIALLSGGNITSAAMVPAMLTACLSTCDGTTRDFLSLKCIMYGASPISVETLQGSMALFDCDFLQVYGMTETHSMITVLGAEDHRRAVSGKAPKLLTSCGRATPGTEIRIVSPEGDDCLDGQQGELICRGSQNMTGYWNRPDATSETLVNGWLHTGDAAYRDTDGYLYIVDRLKDIIVSGGENIAPSEVENALARIPGVLEVSVIGIPDPQWGEAVAAFIVLETGQRLNESDVLTSSRAHLAGFKLPKLIRFLDALPRNSGGKVLRTELRKPFWGDHARAVS